MKGLIPMNGIFFVAALLFVFAISADPGGTLTVETRDADTDSILPAQIVITGLQLHETERTSYYVKYAVPADSPSTLGMVVDASAGESHWTRRLEVHLHGLKGQDRWFRLYLARKSPPGFRHPYSTIPRSEEIRISPDRALVKLLRIREETVQPDKLNQYWVRLRYNLASAAFQNCTNRFVDTCELALGIFNDLAQNFDRNQDLFSAEGIKRSQLSDPGVVAHALRMRYLRAKWNRSIGNLDDAIDDLEDLRLEVADQPEIARSVGLTQERIERDLQYYRTLAGT